eukprot:CAMPEP_0197662504 /NCGR_PEP_ID=MMETSP1338-20131121/53686_1 /TAXON_ID=43686 ORGANISM="Pelagodinium beii, Strain RCC1491" /NCGR_SAMPLE_ID=MMETSP1338 /ASSEMBLY_ACC=CAM_ASM_000754 /LENGTH=56 /DNA_ID=CAMNT_0043240391 /DNA_START=14 /DNA_END=181 /DNA_ORIENTATION=+
MPRRAEGNGLIWVERRKGVASALVVSFPSRAQRISSVPVSKTELAEHLLELCRQNA